MRLYMIVLIIETWIRFKISFVKYLIKSFHTVGSCLVGVAFLLGVIKGNIDKYLLFAWFIDTLAIWKCFNKTIDAFLYTYLKFSPNYDKVYYVNIDV